MADNGDGQQPLFNGKFGVILIAMGSASFVVTMYHLIVICCRNSTEQARQDRAASAQAPSAEEGSLASHQIPSHKYEKKNCDDGGDGGSGTCAVCLGDFEEGDELRTMPLCMHSFHVPCIDMWLNSHSSCPICRADATPLPVMPHCLLEVGSSQVGADHSIDMVQVALVQNSLATRF